jgi:ubiquinol-cytochrome c reductase cytochrome c1 subunit
VHRITGFEQTTPGTMTQAQFDDSVADLVGFLQWMAEPNQKLRVRLGVWVLLFLAVFTVVVWRMNASYWKEVK